MHLPSLRIRRAIVVACFLIVSNGTLSIAQDAGDTDSQSESTSTAERGSSFDLTEQRADLQEGRPPAEIDWQEILGEELGDNLRLTLDLSSRVLYNVRTGEGAILNFIGFDLHKVFSDESGDWGTLTLQGYTTNVNKLSPHPPFYEDDDDWEFVPRIFNFNFTRIGRGRFNIKVGHFEIPYGLELPINTNGTLRDFTHGRNIGVKADWGITANGVFPLFEYEVGLSRGSGIEYSHHGNPWIIAGRFGTPSDDNLVLGLSFMHGVVQSPMAVGIWRSGIAPRSRVDTVLGRASSERNRGTEGVIRRTRAGFDVQWYVDQFGLLGEVSFGKDYDQDVFNALAEFNWRNADETWFAYVQGLLFSQRFHRGWDDAIQAKVGVRWAPDRHWSFGVQYTQDVTIFGDGTRGGILAMQVRYRL